MPRSPQDLTHILLDMAKSAGAEQADAIAVRGTSLSIDVRGGALEQADRSEGTDIGVRVMIGAKQACVSASDTSDATLREIAQRAVAMASVAPDDAYIRQATSEQFAQSWDIAAFELSDPSGEPDAATLKEKATHAEAAALAIEGVQQVQSASAAFGERDLHLATTAGFSGGYARTDHVVSCVAVAGTGTGMERDYDGDGRIFASDLRDAADIGQSAGTRAVARLGGQKPPTGQFPILFDERISSSLIGHILGAINGAAVARGATWLRDDLGKQILPDGIDLIENPFRKRIAGSRPFDAEGLPTATRKIIDNGVLTSWTMDLRSAAQLGMTSTASAQRGTSSPPSPGAGNVTLTQGLQSRQELLSDMGTGLLVTGLIGASINENTGDYSRGASGYWVENGVISHPVNECTIAGNLREMLKTIRPANDARPYIGRVVPSLLVEGLTIAGK